MASTSDDKRSTLPPPDLAARLAALEGRLAGSWTSYTRDEYEKNFRDGIKQDILNYVAKVAIGLLAFLGGAGAFFIQHETVAAYGVASEKVVQGLKTEFAKQADWQRYQSNGVADRNLAEVYYRSTLDPSKKQDALEEMFERAERDYEQALASDHLQSSTFFEIAELEYKYAREYKVNKWDNRQHALVNYKKAASLVRPEQIENGLRARSLTMAGTIELEIYKQLSQSSPQRDDYLKDASEHLRQAKADYETVTPALRDSMRPDKVQTLQLLTQIDKLQRGSQ